MSEQLNKQEALKVLEQVCATFVGNLKDHETVQRALNVFRQMITDDGTRKEIPEDKG